MICGHTDVGGAVCQHAQHRGDHATGCSYLAPVVAVPRGLTEEVSEELVRAVHEMDIHEPSLPAGGMGDRCLEFRWEDAFVSPSAQLTRTTPG